MRHEKLQERRRTKAPVLFSDEGGREREKAKNNSYSSRLHQKGEGRKRKEWVSQHIWSQDGEEKGRKKTEDSWIAVLSAVITGGWKERGKAIVGCQVGNSSNMRA